MDAEYDRVKNNTVVRNECVISCAMPCKTSFYLLNYVSKKQADDKPSETTQSGRDDLAKAQQNCQKTINLVERSYYRRNEAIGSFRFFTFLMDLSNLASVLFNFKYQNVLHKLLKRCLLGKRLLNDQLNRKNLNFLSVYLGLAIALLQLIYYLDDYIRFETYKRMEIGKRSSTDEPLSISVCYDKDPHFLYSNLNYNQTRKELFLTDYRESIESISMPSFNALNYSLSDAELDNLVFNQTQIFFKDAALCYLFSFKFDQLLYNYGSLYFSYFVQYSNQITIKYHRPFDHFYLTRNGDLPYSSQKFFFEQYYTSYEWVELKYPMVTNCSDYSVFKEERDCINQFECFQV